MTVTRFQQKRGTSAQWAASVTPLRDGELGIDKDTGIIKVGDGFTLWADLPAAFESQYLPLLGKAKDSYRLDGLASTDFLRSDRAADFLPVGGKAADADKLDGIDSTGFLKTADATSFLAATGKAVDADKLDGLDSLYFAPFATVDDRTLPASANRKLVAHWGSGTSFPVVGVLQGDTFVRSDVGTGGSLWIYIGSGKGIGGWVHKGTLVCTSTTRPAAGVLYESLEIWETDTKQLKFYDGVNWVAVNGQWIWDFYSTNYSYLVTTTSGAVPTSLQIPGIVVPPGRQLDMEISVGQVNIVSGVTLYASLSITGGPISGVLIEDGLMLTAPGAMNTPVKLTGTWVNAAPSTATLTFQMQATASAANGVTLYNGGSAGGHVGMRHRIL